ncbi:MAG: ribonuclease domain-containing protein [Flavobacteriaceae bacterium]|nr:ribonuclease domain-containing protein [Flavobacteriaceae bacterium]
MTKRQIWLSVIFGIIFSLGLYDFLSNLKTNKELMALGDAGYYKKKKDSLLNHKDENIDAKEIIDELTAQTLVINYIKKHRQLPGYYITKAEARRKGWIPAKGNLCEVLPGKAIGGDVFRNREGKLPTENQYFEADVNYQCGTRKADRIIFTKQGEVWLSKDHYKTFEKQ